jgi:hypothetical protein
LTFEEIRVLKECNYESFWYRCVPLTIALVGGTQLMVNRGILKPHPTYGALLKNMGACLLGYIGGKFSYRNTCRDKILQLPNSPLADAIRKSKGTIGETLYDESRGADRYQPVPLEQSQEPSSTRKTADTYMAPESHGLDESRRPQSDYGTSYQHSATSREQSSLSSASSSAGTDGGRKTYDDLRRQNRAEYEKKVHTGVSGLGRGTAPGQRPHQPVVSPSSADATRPADDQTESSRRNVQHNKYGDVIET